MSESEAHVPAGRIVGRYVIFDEIASGGMASVHLGRLIGPKGFSRTVAIKRMHPQLARDPEFSAMFLDEARLAARIRHPNVVPILDVIGLADELFLVMDYVPGETLSRLVRTAREASPYRIPLEIGLAMVTDALYGLHAAHEAKGEDGHPLLIVHRDVSPQNVIVGVDGVARVLDFGLAKATARASDTQSGLRGKVAYMAPEQLRRQPLDRRTDVFAAAIVLWEVLTGARLFAADAPASSVTRVLEEPIAPPSRLVPALPGVLDDIVMKGLERDPARRFNTAHEMATALEAAIRIARPAEVGAWVAEAARENLARRAERTARIESAQSAPIPPSERTADAGSHATVLVGDRARGDEVSPKPTPNRLRFAAIAGLGILVALGVLALRGRSDGAATSSKTAPEAVPTASAPVEPSAPPPPPPPATASPPPNRVATPGPPATAHPPRPGPVRTTPRQADECDPPYYFDANGVKRFKPKCI